MITPWLYLLCSSPYWKFHEVGVLYLTCSRSSVNICWICTSATLIPHLFLILCSCTFLHMAASCLTFPARNASGAPHYLHYKTLYLSWWNKSNRHLFQLHLVPLAICTYTLIMQDNLYFSSQTIWLSSLAWLKSSLKNQEAFVSQLNLSTVTSVVYCIPLSQFIYSLLNLNFLYVCDLP